MTRCRGCGNPLTGDDRMADGCPCNAPRGINHGVVPKHVCTCDECDPAQTGCVRPKPVGVDNPIKFREFL
jgi:hypothetical protein